MLSKYNLENFIMKLVNISMLYGLALCISSALIKKNNNETGFDSVMQIVPISVFPKMISISVQ